MRKKIVNPNTPAQAADTTKWLDLAIIAQVEISSEDEGYPIEAALSPGNGAGWRAAQSGTQTIRILFDEPQSVRRIQLEFTEPSGVERSQEFCLSAASGVGQPYREIVRQQYNFSSDSRTEKENYTVELPNVSALELVITPDRSGGGARASLGKMRVA